MTLVWFALAAAGAGLVRHGVNRLGYAWLGTLAINVAGSFALGLLLGSDLSDEVVTILGTAGCGSLTTFSMFALETVEARDRTRVTIVLGTVVATVLAAAIGWAVA